jgi:hypothetical protein
MGWLLRQGAVLASLDVASSASAAQRSDGDSVGAQIRHGARLAANLGTRGVRDLAWLDKDLVVRDISHLGSFGVRLCPHNCSIVLLADRGAFERWQLACGDQLEVRE